MKRRGFLGLIAGLFGVASSGKLLASAESGTASDAIVCPPMVWGESIQQVECRGMYFAIKTDAAGAKWYYPMSDIEIGCPAVTIRRFEGIDGRFALTAADLNDPRDSKVVSKLKESLCDCRYMLRVAYGWHVNRFGICNKEFIEGLVNGYFCAAQMLDEARGIV